MFNGEGGSREKNEGTFLGQWDPLPATTALERKLSLSLRALNAALGVVAFTLLRLCPRNFCKAHTHEGGGGGGEGEEVASRDKAHWERRGVGKLTRKQRERLLIAFGGNLS